MNKELFFFTAGVFTLFISVTMWIVDLAGFVEPCIYCRSERTIIGILAIILLAPAFPFISRYLAYVFGFFGAYVAAAQIFMHLSDSEYFHREFLLAICALFIIIAQVMLIFYREIFLPRKKS